MGESYCLTHPFSSDKSAEEEATPAPARKFRFPYTPGCTETLDGELRLPVWGPQTTTECRLLVTPRQEEPHFATKSYDHQCLWEQLFYFNTEADEAAFKTAGLCRCFDCSREVDLLASYLMQRREVDSSGLAAAVVELARDVSIGCGRGPSGLLDAPKAPWQVQAEKDDAQMPPTKRVKSGSSDLAVSGDRGVVAMASVLVNTRETSEDQLDWLQKHRAREVDQLRKENGQLCGELQRLRAQLAQLKNLEEKAQRHERQELQLQKGVEEMQVELDQSEQRCEQQQQQISGLQEQLTTAKANEAELESLRERVRRSDEDLRVLNAKVMDLTAEREEAKRQLIRSDKVCTELLQEMKELLLALELLKQENKELQLAERSRLENHQHEIQVLKNEIHQLITECQSLRHQVSDSNKAQELFEERLKSKDQQIQTQDVELQRSRREAEEERGSMATSTMSSVTRCLSPVMVCPQSLRAAPQRSRRKAKRLLGW
eukprot:g31461.t1